MRFWIVAIAALVVAGTGTVRAQDIAPRPAEAAAALAAAHDAMMRAMQGPGVLYSGDPDLDFVTQMIPHHQGAIEMAKLELEYGTTPDVRKLARAIITTQEAEIAEMTRWKADHVPAPTADAAAIRAGYEASNRKMAAEMRGHNHPIRADLTFLRMMIPHHQGAIDMADVQLRYGKEPEIRALAARIMAAQRDEIVQMKLLIQEDHEH
jgi:uncharacterized protein (DUF305 family)